MASYSVLKQKWLDRVSDLLSQADDVLSNSSTHQYKEEVLGHTMTQEDYDTVKVNNYYLEGLSLLNSIYQDSEHPCVHNFHKNHPVTGLASLTYSRGALEVVKREVENDWIVDPRSVVVADIFTDHIEMAEHLLKKKWKDPAAVMIGSTLELHLRELSKKHGITVANSSGKHVKASKLNEDLVKASAYNATNAKLVTGWLGIRNDAAHGKYSEYTVDQVKNMKDGVMQFMAQYPA